MIKYEYYKKALSNESMPAAFVDLDLFDANVEAIRKRAGDKNIRIASKSIRCVNLMRRILDSSPQFQGIMCYTATEALWLSEQGFDDLLVAYPTVQVEQIRAVAKAVKAGKKIYLMTDAIAHLARIQAIAESEQVTIPICVDLDMSSRWSFLHFGVYRSGLWNLDTLTQYLSDLVKFPNLKLVAAMGYEAQIAGVGNKSKGKGLMQGVLTLLQRSSKKEVAKRRAAMIALIRSKVDSLQIVNGGGTGSMESTREEEHVTEIAAGSGFYAPTLFDAYSHFRHEPAVGYAIEIVRNSQKNIYTCLGGGYVASGTTDKSKAPSIYLPEGATLFPNEMAGEVQTPIMYKGSITLNIGDPVFLRHSKAGELCEHFESLCLIRDGKVVNRVETYRGAGQCFLG